MVCIPHYYSIFCTGMSTFKHSLCARKLKLFAMALLLLVSGVQNARGQVLDSLRTILNSHISDDTNRVNLYASVASEYRNASTDSMVAVALRGILLADKIRFEKGKARCLASLGVANMFKNDLEMADSICTVAIELLQRSKDSVGMCTPFYYMGNIRFRQTKYKDAIGYFQYSVRFAEITGDSKIVGKSLDNIGTCHIVLGNNTEALSYFLKALKLWEKVDNNSGMANSLSNMARVYVSIGNHAKALDYINQSIAIQKGFSDVQTIIHSYLNAMSIYTAMGNDSAAIAVCTHAIRLADSTGQRSEMTVMLADRGMAYFHAHEYDKAFADYTKCLEPPLDKTAPSIIAQAHIGLGEVWMARGNAKKSIPHLEIAYTIFSENEMYDQAGPAAEELGAAYTQVGDFEKALKYIKLGYTIKDRLFNEENTRQQQQLQFDYELEKKQNQIELLKKDKLIAQGRSEMQRATLWGLLSGFTLVLIIAIQLYRGRQKEKHSKETIALQARNLEELNNFKDKIFSVLSHDLRGPINSISTTVDLLDNDHLSLAEFAVLKPDMKKQLGGLTFLLDNLLKWSKNYITGVTAARPESVNLYKIAHENIALLQAQANEKSINVINNIPQSFTALGDPDQIDIVLRNLISNALKFTDVGGTITLSATTDDHSAQIHISDNGVGMTPEQIRNLFLTSTHASSFGTRGETGTGLGLLLCYEFIKANDGEIVVASEKNKGSTFTIKLPKVSNAV
jgi:signal transduction histidine kinase